MKKGEAKIEFFSNLNYLIQEFEKGLVVSKFLYEKAKINKNFKMTYKQFNKYFNENFKNVYNQTKSALKSIGDVNTIKDTKNNLKTKNEPIVLKIDTKTKKVFDVNFDKHIKEEDIL